MAKKEAREVQAKMAPPPRAPRAMNSRIAAVLRPRRNPRRLTSAASWRVSADNLDTPMRLADEGAPSWRRDGSSKASISRIASIRRPSRAACDRSGDGTHGFTRMVRDVCRDPNKQATLDIVGLDTPVDRRFSTCWKRRSVTLIRNAIDHGIEATADRLPQRAKPAEGVVRLRSAPRRRAAGSFQCPTTVPALSSMPCVTKIVIRNLASAESRGPPERSGAAGVPVPAGLQNEGHRDRGVRSRCRPRRRSRDREARTRLGAHHEFARSQGTKFQLHLPLTPLSCARCSCRSRASRYAIPLAQIARAARVPEQAIQHIGGHAHFDAGGKSLGLVDAALVLRSDTTVAPSGDRAVVILGNREHSYGLVVERFPGECELVVQKLDARLGKVPNVSAAAVMEDGSPVLILDVDDVVRTIGKLVAERRIPPRLARIRRADLFDFAGSSWSRIR